MFGSNSNIFGNQGPAPATPTKSLFTNTSSGGMFGQQTSNLFGNNNNN